MQKNRIKVTRTAHYYTINSSINTDILLYVFHGYAQLASDFIKEFSYLENTNTLVIAPEGLSHFYGRERTPVSSWMTSYEREDEINDQIEYLNKLHQKIISHHTFKKIILLGFSQGVSTLMRWVDQIQENNLELHLCSGSIPPELPEKNKISEKIKELYFYYGDNDRLMLPKQAEIALLKLQEIEINYTSISFKGIHEVPKEAHQNLKDK